MQNSNLSTPVSGGFTATLRPQAGDKLFGLVTQVTRFEAVVVIHAPALVLHRSEAVPMFQILLGERPVYEGRAVITNIVPDTSGATCAVALSDEGWRESGNAAGNVPDDVGGRFRTFLQNSQFGLFVRPEFKIVVADLQMLLFDLQHWVIREELNLNVGAGGPDAGRQQKIVEQLQGQALPLLHAAFERFEQVAGEVPAAAVAAHAAYAKRQLHPLVLCAPFMYRTFAKPLGYPGDYEMVDMMMRPPFEGSSTFAKLLNTYFLDTAPVIAHRNRLTMLQEILFSEACRTLRANRPLRIFNLGCGPAREVQQFVAEQEIADRCEFTLLDFNEETLQHTQKTLEGIKRQHGRRTKIRTLQKSVMQVIKESAHRDSVFARAEYDLVYCAGLFDYLTDDICRRLISVFHRMLAPDGLLVVTNVDAYNPCRKWMEFVVDWFLFYRSKVQPEHDIRGLQPDELKDAPWAIRSDASGSNVFVELRKPAHV